MREQAITQFEILLADRLDLGVMKFVGIGVPVCFQRTGLTKIPTPRQPKVPRASMRPEQRIKRGELKPAHVQLASQVIGGDEASNVTPPKRGEAQRTIHANRNVGSQRRPPGLRVARPDPAAITPDASIAVAMKAPGTLIRTIE